MKTFQIPTFYRSSITGKLKAWRKAKDPRKNDFSPTELDFGPVRFFIARHFGFCYGVENAIEISFKALEENPGKRVFLLSQMIHNPEVNDDLLQRGIRFIMDTDGTQFIPWDELAPSDVVIVPAFGTTLQIEALLQTKGVEVQRYNTTCPFVEKVWNRAQRLGTENYSVVIHGKPGHEETRATFSHSAQTAPSVIVSNMEEAVRLATYMTGDSDVRNFQEEFKGRTTPGFDPEKHLDRIGVVNQTTMLAGDTQAIADFLRQTMIGRYGRENLSLHFADTRDTLCYATNDNQQATNMLLDVDADLAVVVGGYNSSNTSHIVELCEQRFSTYFISSEKEILSSSAIRHYSLAKKQVLTTEGYLPQMDPVSIVLTSGASCPDTIVDRVMLRILTFFGRARDVDEVLQALVRR